MSQQSQAHVDMYQFSNLNVQQNFTEGSAKYDDFGIDQK
jgi:hypothetical protein